MKNLNENTKAEKPGYALPKVGGRNFEGSIEGLEHRLLIQIAEEQEELLPNNALISVFCDAVRMIRYHVDYVQA